MVGSDAQSRGWVRHNCSMQMHRSLKIALSENEAVKTLAKSALATCLLMSASGLSARANSPVIDGVGCGTGCYSTYQQIGPVSRTRYGYPRVPVAIKTTGGRDPGTSVTKKWIIADCQGKRVGLYGSDSDGADAFWAQAYTESGSPNNCHSACGRAYDQWRLLCRAAGELQVLSSESFRWPTKGVFTSGYGWRRGRMHKGIDIANNEGTPIFAAKDGVVEFADWIKNEGYVVVLTHRDGSKTRYLHCSRLLVTKGQSIRQGVKIALMGDTGTTLQPHLGFEILRPGGVAVDPLRMLPATTKAK